MAVKKYFQISGVSPNVASNDRHTAFQQIVESSKIELLNFIMDWNVFEWNAYYEQISNYMEQHPILMEYSAEIWEPLSV